MFLIVMIAFRSAIADWNQVPTGSMKPTILDGDRVVVNKLAYRLRFPLTNWELLRWSAPARGDIITFYSPLDSELLIKRVIGIPGDQIALANNALIVNGKESEYSRIDNEVITSLDRFQKARHRFFYEHIGQSKHPVMVQPGTATAYNSFDAITVPPGKFLVLGDNRDNSVDSRDSSVAFVPFRNFIGQAELIFRSWDKKWSWWQVWNWHKAVRFKRVFGDIR